MPIEAVTGLGTCSDVDAARDQEIGAVARRLGKTVVELDPDATEAPPAGPSPVDRWGSTATSLAAVGKGVTMQVREATIDDLEAIVALLADDELGRQRENPVTMAPYRRAFDAIRDDPSQLLVVLDDAGEVVGTLQVSFIPNLTFRGGWRAQVEGVRIAASHRGEGLGRVLLEWAVQAARDRGCHLVQLTTNRDRPEAHRFYERLGFVASHVGMKLYLDEAQ